MQKLNTYTYVLLVRSANGKKVRQERICEKAHLWTAQEHAQRVANRIMRDQPGCRVYVLSLKQVRNAVKVA